jgi:hypothetical protein
MYVKKTFSRVFALGALVLLFPVWGHAATVDDLAKAQLELYKEEMAAKLREAKNKGNAASAGGLPSGMTGGTATPLNGAASGGAVVGQDGREIKRGDEEVPVYLTGIYGVGTDLKADFLYGDAVLTVSRKTPKFGPWKLKEVTASMVQISRGSEVRTLYVQSPPAAGTQGGMQIALPSGTPPVPPSH